MDRRPVGLMERVKVRARAQTAPICAMVLLGGRSMARNRDCQDDLTLAQADAGSAPRSARLREALASSLFERDPVRNLDAAIHEGETAMEIMRPLPADKVFQQTPARLGNYYRMKGDAAGAGENRGWYEKSLRVLLGAREASQAIEQAYDQAQLMHHKPLATRVAYQPVYLELGITLTRLGRNGEATDAYRYGRPLWKGDRSSYPGSLRFDGGRLPGTRRAGTRRGHTSEQNAAAWRAVGNPWAAGPSLRRRFRCDGARQRVATAQ